MTSVEVQAAGTKTAEELIRADWHRYREDPLYFLTKDDADAPGLPEWFRDVLREEDATNRRKVVNARWVPTLRNVRIWATNFQLTLLDVKVARVGEVRPGEQADYRMFYAHDFSKNSLGGGSPYLDPAIVIYVGGAPYGTQIDQLAGVVPAQYVEFISQVHGCFGSSFGLLDGTAPLSQTFLQDISGPVRAEISRLEPALKLENLAEIHRSPLGYVIAVDITSGEVDEAISIQYGREVRIDRAPFWALLEVSMMADLRPAHLD
ncbi:hypothetical protein [Corynebacterium heidelbergense]|nr:hypothetical protein [Corynebacterium heidelbergense]